MTAVEARPTTATATTPIGIDDLCRVTLISDPRIAPDGSRVAYVATRLDHDRNRYLSQIWLADAGGGAPRRFTGGQRRDTDPRWSPDGARLAFLSDREGGKRQVWIVDTAGGEAWRLTDVTAGVSDPVWSPDGARLAFTARVGDAYAEAKTSDGDTYKPPRRFTRNRYKADGEGFLDDTRRQVFVVDVPAEAPASAPSARQVTDGDWESGNPTWSPDGRWLAVASNRTDDREYNGLGDIWVVDATTPATAPRRLTGSNGAAQLPAWSPDGRFVAYIGHDRAPEGSGVPLRLYVAPADGSGAPRCLTPDLDRSLNNLGMGDLRQGPADLSPIWSPDSRSVYFLAGDSGDTPLWAATLDGDVRRVVEGRVTCLSASVATETGDLAVLVETTTAPAGVRLVPATGDTDRELNLRQGLDLTAERAISVPEKFSYPADDGYALDGWLIYPPGFDPEARRYPLLLKIHGGPHAMYGEGFQHEMQWFAGLGFVVLYTNPRGSQGYGEEHALCIRGDWGNRDYRDVMAGVDAVVARGYVDESRMVIAGASYGGYLSSWIIGHDHRFAAALPERPVVNFYSFYGTSDIGFSFGAWETAGLPQADLDRYMRTSPITYADRIRTPCFIVCGDADHRTPIEQSEQLYVTLHRNRVPVEFLRYPDESHALAVAGQPRHRIDRLNRIEAWLRGHLGDFAPRDRTG